MNGRELAWAAGLFEGEGCIGYESLDLSMTDEDSVRRFHAAVRVGRVYGPLSPPSNLPNWKPQWRWRTFTFPDIQAVLVFLWFGLGERRRTRARDVLRAIRYRTGPGFNYCPQGHEFTQVNKYLNPTTGKKHCRMCNRDHARRVRAARKSA